MGCLGACWPGCAAGLAPRSPAVCGVSPLHPDTGSRAGSGSSRPQCWSWLPTFKQCSERDGGCLPSRDVFGRLSDALGEPCPFQGTSGDTGLACH